MKKIIAQGAEALLVREKNYLLKKRISKGYRHPGLDLKLRKRRTKSESRLLEKAIAFVNAPKVSETGDDEIKMDFIAGKTLCDYLDSVNKSEAVKICFILGKEIAKLHNSNIIHGDLTTSNMIWHNQKNADAFLGCSKIRDFRHEKIYFIDFGLGFHSQKIEDKAVDLHLLKQALESKHFERWKDYFDSAIKGYRQESKEANNILNQLEKVESRGRYKGKH